MTSYVCTLFTLLDACRLHCTCSNDYENNVFLNSLIMLGIMPGAFKHLLCSKLCGHNLSMAIYHSPTHSLTQLSAHPPTHSLTHSPTHPSTHLPTHLLTHSLIHPHTQSPTHSVTHSLTHTFIHFLLCNYLPLPLPSAPSSTYNHSIHFSSLCCLPYVQVLPLSFPFSLPHCLPPSLPPFLPPSLPPSLLPLSLPPSIVLPSFCPSLPQTLDYYSTGKN